MTKPAVSRQYEGVSESERLDSFDAVYARDFDYVWRLLGRLGVPAADLPDAAHDVFVIVYKKWDELDPARPLRPWLFGVTRRVASDARKKQRPEASDTLDPAVAPPPHAERDLLWRALSALDEDRCVVFVLHDLEGHTGLEIAAMLDIPPNTVHSRLRLARADLAAIVQRLRGEP